MLMLAGLPPTKFLPDALHCSALEALTLTMHNETHPHLKLPRVAVNSWRCCGTMCAGCSGRRGCHCLLDLPTRPWRRPVRAIVVGEGERRPLQQLRDAREAVVVAHQLRVAAAVLHRGADLHGRYMFAPRRCLSLHICEQTLLVLMRPLTGTWPSGVLSVASDAGSVVKIRCIIYSTALRRGREHAPLAGSASAL